MKIGEKIMKKDNKVFNTINKDILRESNKMKNILMSIVSIAIFLIPVINFNINRSNGN